MAFGRLERTPHAAPMSDINMTPLIDVMLVLLVVFMVTAPLMSSSLPLDLPQTEAVQPAGDAPSISVALAADGRLAVDDTPVDTAALTARLGATARQHPETEVLLRADTAVPYGRVAQLIGLVQQAGLSRIGFVANPASAAAH